MPQQYTELNIFVGEAAFTFILGSFYIDVDAIESSLLSWLERHIANMASLKSWLATIGTDMMVNEPQAKTSA